jgi:hypothetical protein
MTTNEAQTIGRNAFLAGEPSAPILNPVIAEAVANLPVGGGAAQIMKAFVEGWHTANLEAAIA